MQQVKFKQKSFLLKVCSLVLISGVYGCNESETKTYQNSGQAAAIAPNDAPVFKVDKPKEKGGRRFKLNLNLDKPSDLKVVQGDAVAAGQTIVQKELTEQQQLARMRFVTQMNSVEKLPQKFYLTQANQEVELAQARLNNYINSSPFTDAYEPLSRMVQRQELESQLAAAANKRNTVLSQLEIARQEAQLKKEQIALQLRTLDASLEQLKVKSPYTGTVRRVKVERGSNNQIAVVLTIQTNDLQ